MKTKILIVFAILLLSSCGEDINKHKANFYWNEDFTLVDRKENTTVYDNKPAIIRTWVIQRNIVTNDSIELAVINTVFENGDDPDKNCGCTSKSFKLNTVLWYSKNIGDNLHFDYIAKYRFFKKAKDSGVQFKADNTNDNPTVTTKTISAGAITTTTTTVGITDDMEKQNKILELERQKISIDAELERLKIK